MKHFADAASKWKPHKVGLTSMSKEGQYGT